MDKWYNFFCKQYATGQRSQNPRITKRIGNVNSLAVSDFVFAVWLFHIKGYSFNLYVHKSTLSKLIFCSFPTLVLSHFHQSLSYGPNLGWACMPSCKVVVTQKQFLCVSWKKYLQGMAAYLSFTAFPKPSANVDRHGLHDWCVSRMGKLRKVVLTHSHTSQQFDGFLRLPTGKCKYGRIRTSDISLLASNIYALQNLSFYKETQPFGVCFIK